MNNPSDHCHTGEALAIVILNWNGCQDTLECLDSLRTLEGGPYRIYVADNGSTDDSVVCIRARYPEVRLLENRANLGFAGGNNPAIARALAEGAHYVLLLNNDTLAHPGMPRALLAAARRHPHAGILGPKIYRHGPSDELWYAGGYWDPRTLSFEEHGAGEIDRGQYDLEGDTAWIIGCAMFVRAEVFQRIGLLDAAYFLNNEEIDFCSRARKAGYGCLYVPEAKLWHKVSVSFGGEDSPLKLYFSTRNRLLWAKRNASAALRWRIYTRTLRSVLRRFDFTRSGPAAPGTGALRRHWWQWRAAVRDARNQAALLGLRDFLLGRFGDCPASVRERSRRWSAGRQSERGAERGAVGA